MEQGVKISDVSPECGGGDCPQGGRARRLERAWWRTSLPFSDAFFATGRLKRLRGAAKQFLPYGYMRRHLARVYGMSMPARGGNALTRMLWDMAPFYFAQDREAMERHSGHERDAVVKRASGDSARRLSRIVKSMRGKDELSVMEDILRRVERIAAGAAYDLAASTLDEIAAFSQAFPQEGGKARLSALLHRMDLPNVLDLLDGGPHDKTYQTVVGIFNAPPLPAVADAACLSQEDFRRTPPSASPKMTFVVPVFNEERCLVRCLESLRRQDEGDIEIVCIDDGSQDASAKLLDRIAKADGRMRVVHKANEGVSAARNLGLQMARGRYVAFVDGDDWLSADMCSKTVTVSEANGLDVCFFDFECVDSKTKERMGSRWTMASRASDWVFDRVFAMRELPNWGYCGSACMQVFRRDFLERSAARFPVGLRMSEDAMFMHRLAPLVERAMCMRDVLYHRRKGKPLSAVSRLSGGDAVRAEVESAELYLDAAERLLEDYYRPRFPVTVCASFAQRVFSDISRLTETTPAVAGWIECGNCREIVRLAKWWRSVPPDAARMMEEIELARAGVPHDLYLVAGQLACPNVDQIDSWQFFRWLQDHGVPSRYLVWRDSSFLRQIEQSGSLKDVVVMETNCRNDELLHRADLLSRAKALVVEWHIGAFPDEWLRQLRGLSYVFLQHGVTGCWLTPEHRATFKQKFNYCNVSSKREQELIEGGAREPGDCGFFVAGLPRYDLLDAGWRRARKGDGRFVFVMLTWREGLNVGGARLMNSAYWQGLSALLSRPNRERLARIGVGLVVAPHHKLLQFVHNLDFGQDVKVVSQGEIARWIRKADAMVTDFSSASFDFMFQNKPTIYWIPDRDDPLLDRSVHQDGGKVDSALALRKNFYNTVDTVGEVMDLIEYYSSRDFELEPEKRAVAATYFGAKEGISQRVYEQIEKVANR